MTVFSAVVKRGRLTRRFRSIGGYSAGVRLIWVYLGVFLLAVLVRAVVWMELRNDAEFHQLVGDSQRYDQWAGDIANGDWLSRREGVFYQAPLYPYFLALHKLAFGNNALTAVRISQICMGGLSAVLLAMAGRQLAGVRGALIAGITMSVVAAGVFFDLQIDKATLDGVIVSAILLAIVRFQYRARWHGCAALGALIGLLALNRENAIALLAVVLPMAWIGSRRVEHWPARNARWALPSIVVVAFLAVVLPISIRNRIVGGEFHLVTCQFGPNFYIGNGTNADGLYRPLREGRGDPAFERTDATELAEIATGQKLSPRGVSRYWASRTLHDMTSRPLSWLGIMGRKLLLVFHATEIADNNDLYTLSSSSTVLRLLCHATGQPLLVLLALAGAILGWRGRAIWWPVAGCIAVMTMAIAAFYLFARYRFCMAPMLILMGSACRTLEDRRKFSILSPRGLTVCASIILLVKLLNANWVLPERQRGVAEYNYALACERRGYASDAERSYELAVYANPEMDSARTNLGLIYAGRQEYDAAIREFEHVLRNQPDDPVAHNNLGMALGGKGKIATAAEEFKRAVELDPSYEAAQQNLARARESLKRGSEN